MFVQEIHQKVTPMIWKRDEIISFLDIFESTFHTCVSQPFDSETEMWECISDKLLEQGINASAQHCQNKWNFLYKTYINNPNLKGAFYAKIKQIVEFSNQLGDQQQELVPEPPDEEQRVTDTESVEAIENDSLRYEDLSYVDGQVVELSMNESGEEHLEEIDNVNIPADHQYSSEHVTNKEEIPLKIRRLSSNENKSVHNNCVINDKFFDVNGTLAIILNKIEAISKEQMNQAKRIEIIEKHQNENRQILLDIKKSLDSKPY